MRAVTPSPNSQTAGTRIVDGQLLYSSTSRGYQEFISGNQWNQRYGYDIVERSRNIDNNYTEEDVILEGGRAYMRSQSNPIVGHDGGIYNRFHQISMYNDDNGDIYLECTCEYFEKNNRCKHAIYIANNIE